MLILSVNCVISNPAGAGIFAINYVKVNVLVVTLSTNNNTRLLQQLKSDLNTQLIVGQQNGFQSGGGMEHYCRPPWLAYKKNLYILDALE